MTICFSVILQTGGLTHLNLTLPALEHYSQFVVISHPSLEKLYGTSVLAALQHFNRPIIELSIPEGESSKSLEQAARCWEQMFTQGVDRQAALIALGGGVICDLAGFIGSCYMRGLDVFYLPTTLLAMVDAALGGKTGVNLPEAKNAIGTFHQPKQILIDPGCLLTLPQREFNSGVAEIIKYGIIGDLSLFEKLEQRIEEFKNRQGSFLEEVIHRCIAIKSAIVAQDERDQTGRRAVLNYGHTFGHAIETVTGYGNYLHGEAIAIGMSCAATLSAELGLCDFSLVERQDRLFQRVNLPLTLPYLPVDHLIKAMRSDKKAMCGKINLILLKEVGKVIKVCDVDSVLIQHTLLAKMR